jgi:hypothetical protein
MIMDRNTPQTPTPRGSTRRRTSRRWAVGAAAALAAALLAGGGAAVALQAQGNQPPSSAASDASGADESLASLTSLDGLGSDVAAADSGTVVSAQPAALVAPAAATSTPSPSTSATAKHPARAALRRVLAVIIRQDGQSQYGQHAQTAARELINRYPAAFRKLPTKLRQDLWTLAGAPAGQEVADAHAIKDRALDGTYGTAAQKLAEGIQKAPVKPKPATPSPATPAPSTTPGATTGS